MRERPYKTGKDFITAKFGKSTPGLPAFGRHNKHGFTSQGPGVTHCFEPLRFRHPDVHASLLHPSELADLTSVNRFPA